MDETRPDTNLSSRDPAQCGMKTWEPDTTRWYSVPWTMHLTYCVWKHFCQPYTLPQSRLENILTRVTTVWTNQIASRSYCSLIGLFPRMIATHCWTSDSVEIKDDSVAYFNHIATFEVLYCQTSVKGKAHTMYVLYRWMYQTFVYLWSTCKPCP